MGSGPVLVLPSLDREAISTQGYLTQQLLAQKRNPYATANIIRHLAWQDLEWSNGVLQQLVRLIVDYDEDKYDGIFLAIRQLLDLQDRATQRKGGKRKPHLLQSKR